MKKLVWSIGEATIDAFVFIDEADARCSIDSHRCELSFTYAEKLMAKRLEFSTGGNAANTAVSFSRLGFESYLYSVLGDDWIGKRVLADLMNENIRCDYIQTIPGTDTSYATALVYHGERTLLIYHVPRDYILPKVTEVFDWIYLTSIGKSYQLIYDEVMKLAKKDKVKISFNPGSFQIRNGVTALRPYFRQTYALFLNKEEAQFLTELPSRATINQMLFQLYDMGPKTVIITDGPKGAWAFDGRELWYCDIYPTEIVERTGAGDSFAAGVTAALMLDQPLEQALRWGAINSAGVINEVGPQHGLLTMAKMAETLKHPQPTTKKITI